MQSNNARLQSNSQTLLVNAWESSRTGTKGYLLKPRSIKLLENDKGLIKN